MVYFCIFFTSHIVPFYHSYSSIPSFKSLTALSIYLFLLHIKYIQITHASCFSTSPHRHLSSSYFHVILSLPHTGKHPSLTISLTPAPPSAKTLISCTFFHLYILFLLSVSLNQFFHTCFANLPYSTTDVLLPEFPIHFHP